MMKKYLLTAALIAISCISWSQCGITAFAGDVSDPGYCDSSCTNYVDFVSVSGGTPPYSYQWYTNMGTPLPGETNSSVFGLCPGSYYLEVTDASFCSETPILVDFVVTSKVPSFHSMSPPVVSANASCFGNDGELTITPPGSATGQYGVLLIVNGDTTYYPSTAIPGLSFSVGGLVPGNYEIVPVEDSCKGFVNSVFRTINWDTINTSACGENLISGTVYHDTSSNCLLDSPEDRFTSMLVKTSGPFNTYQFTDSLGRYSFNLPIGSFTTEVYTSSGWTSCPPNYSSSFVFGPPDTLTNLDFGLTASSSFTAGAGYMTSSIYRCNDVVSIPITVVNTGSLPLNGVVSMELDNNVSFSSSVPTPDSIVGNIIYWTISGLPVGNSADIELYINTPGVGFNGSGFDHVLKIDDMSGTNLDTDTMDRVLQCAYDPNDKIVTPEGYGALNYIAHDQELSYTVRFQNTGTDTAFTVLVTDTLDVDLDISTLNLISYSHPVQASIDSNRILRFMFDGIGLPDSATNFLGSQGYVQYTISPVDSLPPFTRVTNGADIYFDSNPPILTNRVSNAIECWKAFADPVATVSGDTLIVQPVQGSVNWYIDNSVFAGSGDTLLATTNGSYHAVVIDTNGCEWASNAVTPVFVGIEHEEEIDINVYPNPASGNVWISGDDLSGAKVEVRDMTGRLCVQKGIYQSPAEVSLDVPSGVYSLSIWIENYNLPFHQLLIIE